MNLMLLHDFVQLVHRVVSLGRELLSQVHDYFRIYLGLSLHFLPQIVNILLFALQLLVFLLYHLLQGLDCLLCSIGNFFLLFASDVQSLYSVILDRVLEHNVLAQILVSFLPHLQSTHFILLELQVVGDVFDPLVELLNLSILLFNHCFCSPVNASSLAEVRVLALESQILVNVLFLNVLGHSAGQTCCLLNHRADVVTLSTSLTHRASPRVAPGTLVRVKPLSEELALVLSNSLVELVFCSMHLALELGSLGL